VTEPLRDPLVPAEVDLRDFQYMELDVRVLRDSRFGAEVSGDAFRAGVMLWCASWHQVPAGSVPDDDIELANLAGFGRFFKEWRKVREQALQGFVKCSDGRLYHQVVCEKANAAWTSKLRHHYDRACDRLRKSNKARKDKGEELIPELTFETWNERRISAGIPMEKAEASAGIPQNSPEPAAGIPPENALRGRGNGEGEGEGDYLSEAKASGATAPPPAPAPAPTPPIPPAPPPAGPPTTESPPDPAEVIFGLGVPLLTAASVSERNARSMLGLMRKTNGDAVVIAALQRAVEVKPLEPVAWLQAAVKASLQPTTKPDRIAKANAEVVRRFAERTGT
jgi:hypothetical protein